MWYVSTSQKQTAAVLQLLSRIVMKGDSKRKWFRVQTQSGTLDWPFNERERWPEIEIRTDSSAVIHDWDTGQKPGKKTPSGQEMLYETYICEWTWEWGIPTQIFVSLYWLPESIYSSRILQTGWHILWRLNILLPWLPNAFMDTEGAFSKQGGDKLLPLLNIKMSSIRSSPCIPDDFSAKPATQIGAWQLLWIPSSLEGAAVHPYWNEHILQIWAFLLWLWNFKCHHHLRAYRMTDTSILYPTEHCFR